MSAAFVASVLAAGVAHGQQPTERQQPAQRQQTLATQKVTISGCIQSAPAAGAQGAAGGAAAGTAARTRFVLANAKPVTGTAGQRGAIGTTGTAAAATRYQLEGEEKEISAHLNHQVEITGTVQAAPAAAGRPGAGAPATGGTAGAGAQTGTAAQAPVLKIESLKMVSATCPQQP